MAVMGKFFTKKGEKILKKSLQKSQDTKINKSGTSFDSQEC
jgi:hypothetical protein